MSTPGNVVRIVSKKSQRREQLTKFSDENLNAVDKLITEIKKLQGESKHDDATALIDIAEGLLKSTRDYQKLVGEILAEMS